MSTLQQGSTLAVNATERWKTALGLATLASVLLLVVYWPTILSIEKIWRRSGNFTHGYLMVPIAAYMLWTIRDELAALTPRPSWLLGPAIALFGALFWVLANMVNVLVVEQLAVVVMLQGLWISIFGRQLARAAAVPLLYLFFAVPFGQGLEPYLQDFTAWFSVSALRLTGIPVLWEGLYITIPTGAFEVAEACSGMRYLMASLALGVLFAFLNYRSSRYRLTFIALSIIVPIIANGLRAYLIIMLAHLSNLKIAVGVDHVIYGWVFFGIVMYLLYRFGSGWREPEQAAKPVSATPAPAAAPWLLTLATGVALLAALVGRPVYASLTAAPASLESYNLQLPGQIGRWVRLDSFNKRWQPTFNGADIVQRGSYQRAGGSIDYSLHYYVVQKQGQELGGGGHAPYRDDFWRRVDGQYLSIPYKQGVVTVKETLLRGRRGEEILLWQCYWVAGRFSDSPIGVKLMEMAERLKGQAGGSAAILLSAAAYNGDSDAARQSLGEFFSDAGAPLNQALTATRPQ